MNFHQHVLVKESELFSFIVEKFFDFDNLRSLENALSGTELHQKLLLLLKNVEEILFGQIFYGANTT